MATGLLGAVVGGLRQRLSADSVASDDQDGARAASLRLPRASFGIHLSWYRIDATGVLCDVLHCAGTGGRRAAGVGGGAAKDAPLSAAHPYLHRLQRPTALVPGSREWARLRGDWTAALAESDGLRLSEPAADASPRAGATPAHASRGTPARPDGASGGEAVSVARGRAGCSRFHVRGVWSVRVSSEADVAEVLRSSRLQVRGDACVGVGVVRAWTASVRIGCGCVRDCS